MAKTKKKKTDKSNKTTSATPSTARPSFFREWIIPLIAHLFNLLKRGLLFLWKFVWFISLVVGAFLAIALFSYHRNDPSFSVASQHAPENLAGLWGAYVSDALYLAFGFSAWWLVLGLAMITFYGARHYIRLWSRHGDEPISTPRLSAAVGMVALMVGSTCLEALRLRRLHGTLPGEPGGALGDQLAFGMSHYVGVGMATVFFMVLMMVGLPLLMDFNWLEVAEKIGAFLERLVMRRRSMPMATTAHVAPAAAVRPMKVNPKEPEAERPTPPPAPVVKVRRENDLKPSTDGKMPLDVLDEPMDNKVETSQHDLEMTGRLIVSKLKSFNIEATVEGADVGPVVTRFHINPAEGVKGSQIDNIHMDLARALGMKSVRVVPTIPGTSYLGLEIPNTQREMVRLKEVLESPVYRDKSWQLPLALGKGIQGDCMIDDLARMPHLLVAGTTGSGKSVGVNAMILSMLHHLSPSELRLLLIDPKMLEFSLYEGIPHLLTPVVTDMNTASIALKWCTREMDRRYELMSVMGVRHFTRYNELIDEAKARGEEVYRPDAQEGDDPLERFPYIVVIIDEFADLIMTHRKEVEAEVTRLVQKSRAAGIHMIIATQRPSSDVLTGLIRTNVATRCCFQVASATDSRIALTEAGAETLLGHGDMLYHRTGGMGLERIQGCFISDDEVARAAQALKRYGEPQYIESLTEAAETGSFGGDVLGGKSGGESDPLYDKAVEVVLTSGRTSVSFLQRQLGIGFNRASNIVEAMEAAGLVTPPNASGKRDVLVNR